MHFYIMNDDFCCLDKPKICFDLNQCLGSKISQSDFLKKIVTGAFVSDLLNVCSYEKCPFLSWDITIGIFVQNLSCDAHTGVSV